MEFRKYNIDPNKMASSYTSSPRYVNDSHTDCDDADSLDFEDDRDLDDNYTDEDTEDASETDMAKQQTEYTEIKEQMYQDKLAHLKKQLQQLEEGTLPEYLKKKRKIDQQFKERNRINELWREYELEMVEKEYIAEQKAAAKEFEEKKIDLKEHLVCDYEEKKRSIDNERTALDLLSGFLLSDTMEPKPVSTRKLRRRPNDPIPLPEKRRKPSPAQIDYYLDETEIMEDLRIINKVSGKPFNRKYNLQSYTPEQVFDAKIDDGKLLFDKKWFHRNQQVFIESKEGPNFNGVITAIGTQEFWVKKTSDSSKIRIYVSQLQKGRFIIRRRNT